VDGFSAAVSSPSERRRLGEPHELAHNDLQLSPLPPVVIVCCALAGLTLLVVVAFVLLRRQQSVKEKVESKAFYSKVDEVAGAAAQAHDFSCVQIHDNREAAEAPPLATE
jgi:hypothetical protein